MFITVVLVFALVLAAFALAALAAAFLRIARNVGLLDLEDYAHRNGVKFVPVSAELVRDLQTWSQPAQLMIREHSAHPHLVELVVKPVTPES
jgi:hypothetical protein